jgi:hypothetical protein
MVRKGSVWASTSLSILAIALIERVDLLEVKPKQEAMMPRHPAAQGLAQEVRRGSDPLVCQPS